MHDESSVGIRTVHVDFERLAPNRTLSRHLLTNIIYNVFCCIHLYVHFGIKSHAQLAIVNNCRHASPLFGAQLETYQGPIVSWVSCRSLNRGRSCFSFHFFSSLFSCVMMTNFVGQ